MPREKPINRGESQQDWNVVTLKKNSKQLINNLPGPHKGVFPLLTRRNPCVFSK